MSTPFIYDKAKYHFATIRRDGLPEIHAYIHTGLFVGWLIEHGLLDAEFECDAQGDIEAFREKRLTGPEVFHRWDGVLLDDMLSDEGNAFAKSYFDLERGQYLDDYIATLAKGLPNELHVEDTWENYANLSSVIDQRHAEWMVRRRG